MKFTIRNRKDGSELVKINGKAFYWTMIKGQAAIFSANDARKICFECSLSGFDVEQCEADERIKSSSLARKQKVEELESLNGQLEECKKAIKKDLELWEKREYRYLITDYKKRIEELKEHIEFCDENSLW